MTNTATVKHDSIDPALTNPFDLNTEKRPKHDKRTRIYLMDANSAVLVLPTPSRSPDDVQVFNRQSPLAAQEAQHVPAAPNQLPHGWARVNHRVTEGGVGQRKLGQGDGRKYRVAQGGVG